MSGSGAQGLALAASSIAQNVIVADDPTAVATNAVGIRVDGSRVESTTVSLYRGAGNTGIQQVSGPTVVSRSSVRASGTAVAAQGGALAIDNSVLNLDDTGQTGLRAEAGSTVDARHLTVVGSAGGSRGVLATTTGAAAAITLVNSIVHGPADSVVASGADASVVVHHSDLKAPVEDAGGTVTEGVGNLPDVDPAFIDPAFAGPGGGTLALRAGSPVVDKGDPLTSTGNDRNGDGRAFDGDGNGSPIPDMGAYELRDITAPVTTFIARPQPLTNDNTPVFQFRSEDGARFECRLDGGRVPGVHEPDDHHPAARRIALPDRPGHRRGLQRRGEPAHGRLHGGHQPTQHAVHQEGAEAVLQAAGEVQVRLHRGRQPLRVQARPPTVAQLRLDVQVLREGRQAQDPRQGDRRRRQHRRVAGALQVQEAQAAPLTCVPPTQARGVRRGRLRRPRAVGPRDLHRPPPRHPKG